MGAESLETLLELASDAIAHKLSAAGFRVGRRRILLVAYDFQADGEDLQVDVREALLGTSSDTKTEIEIAAKVLRTSADSFVERGKQAELRHGPGGQ